MRAILQRVHHAQVMVDGAVVGQINRGWLVLLGISRKDSEADLHYLVAKTLEVRAFAAQGKPCSLSIQDIGGQILVVSQFTLFGDCRKGRRPSFSEAAPPGVAAQWYQRYLQAVAASGLTVASGVFGATMQVSMAGDGPMTLVLDSQKAT